MLRLTMGLARFHAGRFAEASECLEIAREHFDAGPSVWHIPILHQYAALAACATDEVRLRDKIVASLEALRGLAGHCPANFAHRVNLVEGELARLDGDRAGARARLELALRQAREGEWTGDEALAHELLARVADDPAGERAAARAIYVAWGALGKANQLA